MKYVKKAIPVDAWQVPLNPDHTGPLAPQWLVQLMLDNVVTDAPDASHLLVRVDGAWLKAMPGDWIMLDAKGLPYPCSAEVFALTYEPLQGMDFGDAIRMLKGGQRVARRGWNGKGMYLWLMPAAIVKSEWCKEPHLKQLADENGGEIECLGTVRMYTTNADGRRAVLTGWLASQSDMLATDWEVVA